MTVEELLAALEQQEGGAEMIGVVKFLAGEITKKNNEAKNLRTRLKATEENVTAVNGKFSKVAEFLGLEEDAEDVEAALEALKAKQSEKKPGGDPGNPQTSQELAQLTSQLNQLQRDLKKISTEKETFAQTAAQEKAKRMELLRDSALKTALANGKAIKPDLLAKILQSNIKTLDDGSEGFVFVADDGNEVTIDEGVKSFLDTNPDFVTNGSRPGAGSGGGGVTKEPDFDNMSQADYVKWRETQK
jgi:hypothetical protein